MSKFKVGNRVAVYDESKRIRGDKGAVDEINADGSIYVHMDQGDYLIFYPEQCRKLKKRKPRSVWIPKDAFVVADKAGAKFILSDDCGKWNVSLVKPDPSMSPNGWIEFREVKRK